MMLYVALSIIVLMIGVFSLMINRSVVKILIAIEIISVAASMNFILFSWMRQDVFGQALMILALSVDTVVTGVMMALIIILYRKFGFRHVEDLR